MCVQNLRILQINALGATLSTGRTTRELHEFLCTNGHESFIACPRRLDCDDAFFYSSRINVHLDVWFSQLTGYEATFSILSTKKLINYIESLKPDIVHLRVVHTYSLNIHMLLEYLGKSNIATVITLHDCWFMTGLCTYFTLSKCDKWKFGCNDCPNLYMSKYKLLCDRTAIMWRKKKEGIQSIKRLAVVGVSDWVKDRAKESFLSSAKIIKRIYNWIDLSVFYPRDTTELRSIMDLKDKKVILGVSATWSSNSRKGLESYLNLSKVLTDDFVIVLIGTMNYKGSIPSNIICIGRTNSTNELANYYSLADVYLNLSKEETFGKVSAEAVACGTPIVAIDSTANKELIPPGAGMVVASENSSVIFEAIKTITKNPHGYYQTVCRQFAEKNFDKNNNINEYIKLYYQLVK